MADPIDLRPQFPDAITATPVDCAVRTVQDDGSVQLAPAYQLQLVAWVPFQSDAALRTTVTRGGNTVQAHVGAEGVVDLGEDAHPGLEVLVVVLDERTDRIPIAEHQPPDDRRDEGRS